MNNQDKEKECQKVMSIEKEIDITEALEIRDMVNDNIPLEEISKETGRTIPEIERVMELLTSKNKTDN